MMLQLRSRIDFGWVKRPGTFARMADLSMDVRDIDGVPLALVRMPRPEFHPCAHYVGIVASCSSDLGSRIGRTESLVFHLSRCPTNCPKRELKASSANGPTTAPIGRSINLNRWMAATHSARGSAIISSIRKWSR